LSTTYAAAISNTAAITTAQTASITYTATIADAASITYTAAIADAATISNTTEIALLAGDLLLCPLLAARQRISASIRAKSVGGGAV
jgi:hypothetical protein